MLKLLYIKTVLIIKDFMINLNFKICKIESPMYVLTKNKTNYKGNIILYINTAPNVPFTFRKKFV